APGQLIAAKAKALGIGRQLSLIEIREYRRIQTPVGIDLKVADHPRYGALRWQLREGGGDDGRVFEQCIGRDLEQTILLKRSRLFSLQDVAEPLIDLFYDLFRSIAVLIEYLLRQVLIDTTQEQRKRDGHTEQ